MEVYIFMDPNTRFFYIFGYPHLYNENVEWDSLQNTSQIWDILSQLLIILLSYCLSEAILRVNSFFSGSSTAHIRKLVHF